MPRGRKKNVAAEAVTAENTENIKRKPGRPPKAKQEADAKPARKTKKAAPAEAAAKKKPGRPPRAKKAEAAAEKPKKRPGRPPRSKTFEEAIASVEPTAAEKTRRKAGRPAKKQGSTAEREAAEEIINKIIAADFSAPVKAEKEKTAKPSESFTEEEVRVLKAFVKALTKAFKE